MKNGKNKKTAKLDDIERMNNLLSAFSFLGPPISISKVMVPRPVLEFRKNKKIIKTIYADKMDLGRTLVQIREILYVLLEIST